MTKKEFQHYIAKCVRNIATLKKCFRFIFSVILTGLKLTMNILEVVTVRNGWMV